MSTEHPAYTWLTMRVMLPSPHLWPPPCGWHLLLLHAVRADAQALQSSNAQRRARLERQQGQVQTNRTDMLSSYFPHLLRYQSLTHQHVSSMLLHEQKLKLKQVLDILPLQVEGLLPAPGVGLGPGLSGDGSSVALAICGLHIPEQAVQLVDGRLPPEVSAACLGNASCREWLAPARAVHVSLRWQ